ncbi:DUF1444 domain-containing protein [Bacillaceae bacterium SIJ1]|nr:DUF1444 domain-containing protein [Litoribacterium kuwaitense]
MRKKLEQALADPDIQFQFDREKDTLRIEWSSTKKGLDLAISPLIAKYEEREERAVDEIVFHIQETMKAMKETQSLHGKERYVFPVIRSTSFPIETKEGQALIYKDHTAETRIYYALDLGKSYRLIDQSLIEEEQWSMEQLHETALFNIRSLDTSLRDDYVAGNRFSFVNTKDGYDGSRILNVSFLDSFKSSCKGEMAIAVPHQDVLILADIQNEQGYDILGQMAMHFFAEGYIPITALSFLYENKELEPIFILAQKRPRSKK